MRTANLYAGAGGWEAGASLVGLAPIGIELDPDACATRRAAGLATIRADLHDYQLPAGTALDGLIASPPCQIFSQAGSREGAEVLPEFLTALDELDWCGWPDHGYPSDTELLWSVYNWWARHQPRWVACEQVRPVLPFWEALADRMRAAGWHAWTGIVDAADYGVGQNRERAILLAHRDRPVGRPEPTHDRDPHPVLFGEARLPWVSMADALGWPDGAWIDTRRDQRPDGSTQTRTADRPAPAVSTFTGQDQWVLHTNTTTVLAAGRQPYTRELDRPAPTVDAKAGRGGGGWVLNRREGAENRDRALDRPAPTVTTSAVERNWCWDRPATTVTTDARVWPPGHKINQSDIARLGQTEAEARYSGRSGRDAVRVTPAQAAALQSFPPGWPWQGTKTAQARQIGNAVPPLLAWHLLREVAS